MTWPKDRPCFQKTDVWCLNLLKLDCLVRQHLLDGQLTLLHASACFVCSVASQWQTVGKPLPQPCFHPLSSLGDLEESPLPQDVISFLCQQRVDLPCTQSSMRNRTGCGIQNIYSILPCLCVCVCLCTGIGWNWNSFIGFVHRYCIPVPSCSYPSYPGKNAVGLDLMQVRKDTVYETLPWCEPRHCFHEVILFPKGKRNTNIINTMSHMKTLHRGARNLARFRFVDVVME